MAQPQAVKRFYDTVSVGEEAGAFRVMLDARGLRTVKGSPQLVPTRALADAMASEWADQGEEIDPARFVLRDFADYAIDMVRHMRGESIEKLLGYAETDTLCYRAEPDEPLFSRQQEVWEPLLTAFEAREGVQFTRVAGIVHRAQPNSTLDALRERLDRLTEFDLAALEALTTLSASLSIGLSALEPDADHGALWDAANLEEDWQTELWGSDYEAEHRRALRTADFHKAAEFARLARSV